MASKDFNYQVALKEGLKSLEQGRLRQAEQSFKYLVDKFPGAEGGYRGLAKVHFEQDDRGTALRVLRDGAAALTKSGERSAAIALLRQAVVLDPRDFSTHRRLAAALALAGDTDASVQEYARFIRDLRDSGENERARNEVAWAKGQLRGVTGVSSLDAIADGLPVPAAKPTEAKETAKAPTKETAKELAEEKLRSFEREGGTALRPHAADPWATPRPERAQTFTPPPAPPVDPANDPWAAPPPTTDPRGTTSEQRSREMTVENDPNDPWSHAPTPAPSWTTGQRTPVEAVPDAARPAETATDDLAALEPAPTEERWPAPSGNGEPKVETDPAGVEAAAARYLATRDPRAAGMALEAARHYIKEGNTDAASDLLLQLIAAGVADHDAQRLLIDVTRTLGKHEVAKAKCRLLVQALLLDGRNDLAAEVEALALVE
jgi:thioredoxin-like negative regulator of GroEL